MYPRVQKQMQGIKENLQPGSGNIWKNKLTVPTVPLITGLSKQDFLRVQPPRYNPSQDPSRVPFTENNEPS